MESVMQWACSVCISCGIVCIIEMLISDTVLEKTVRYVLGAFMLCAVIVPVGGFIRDISFDFGDFGEISDEIPEDIENERIEYLKSEIKKLIVRNLEDENIFPKEICVNMDIDEDNCISIITADILLENGDVHKSQKIRNVLDSLGIGCNISVLE